MFLRYSPSATEPSPSEPLSMAARSSRSQPGLTRAVTRYRIHFHCTADRLCLVPDPSQQIPAVLQIALIRSEHFERDRTVVATPAKRLDAAADIHRAAAERHVQIRA